MGRSAWPNTEVAGEAHHRSEIRAVLGRDLRRGSEVELDNVPVHLVPEPDNPYDPNAVSVRVNGLVVGYLDRDTAARYRQPIRRIAASGLTATTTARLWARDDNGTLRARATVYLPDPALMLPLNDRPETAHTLIPWSSTFQVTKEKDHFDTLFKHVPPSGTGLLITTLHKGTRTLKNEAERPFVEVRVDGERVGEMSSVVSGHLLPLVEHCEALGQTPSAYAKISGSALAAELTLYATKATELSDTWLSAGPHAGPALQAWAEDYAVAPAYRSSVPSRNRSTSRPEPSTAPTRPTRQTASPVKGKPAARIVWGIVLFVLGLPAIASGAGAPLGILLWGLCAFLLWKPISAWLR